MTAESLYSTAGQAKASQFYMVWNPNRGTPRVKHATHAEAKAEAERLAKKQPGDTFYILRSRGAIVEPKKPDLAEARRRMNAAQVAKNEASAACVVARDAVEEAYARFEQASRELDDATVAFVRAGRA